MVISVGGFGGFFDSVRDIGVVHPPGMNVSAEDAVRGGAGGSLGATGGATNPGSSVPSPAITVPAQSVAASIGSIFLFIISILLCKHNVCFLEMVTFCRQFSCGRRV